jgi:hypothetical protein
LICDLNHDLLNHPYDEEFKGLAAEFGGLLRGIIATIDRYGLKRRHLHKHRTLAARTYRSELTESYEKRLGRKRLGRNEVRLFEFLDHDGVPWNNNNAEHAIKPFGKSRQIADGKMNEKGLSAYLVLLSLCQTCRYRGVSFLRFLLSKERDLEHFCRRPREKPAPPRLAVYTDEFRRTVQRRPASDQRSTEGDRGAGKEPPAGERPA